MTRLFRNRGKSKLLTSLRNPFLVPDLFHCILECLVTLPLSKEEQQTLAALAQTCRAFSEPSLDRLWRRLDSLLPLIRSFADVVDEVKVKTSPSPSEWLVIHRYSHRVQDLTLGNEKLSLYFVQHTDLVLPNLRVFRWKCCKGSISQSPFNSIAFLRPLLIPQITTLELEPDSLRPEYRLFLRKCLALFPNLKSIKFSLPHTTPRNRTTVSPALSKAICSNADWQHVELSLPVDNEVLKHLGMSSTLKTVSLKLAPQTSRPEEPCFGPRDTPFRNVVDLALMIGNSLDVVTYLLRSCDQMFHSFKVTLYTQTFVTEVTPFLTALASPQRVYSLRSLTFDYIPYTIPRPSSDMQAIPAHRHLTCETFRPLVSLVHLRELIIHLDNPTSLNDTEFADLVRNWPQLEKLRMMWARHPASSVTLKGLLSLLASCRELRDIGLTLDARNVPVGTYADADVRHPLLTSPITFCNSPLRRPDLVAKFLLKHMPSLPGVNPMMICTVPAPNHTHHYRSYRRSWARVNEHIRYPKRWGVALGGAKFRQFKSLWSCCRCPGDSNGRSASLMLADLDSDSVGSGPAIPFQCVERWMT